MGDNVSGASSCTTGGMDTMKVKYEDPFVEVWPHHDKIQFIVNKYISPVIPCLRCGGPTVLTGYADTIIEQRPMVSCVTSCYRSMRVLP